MTNENKAETDEQVDSGADNDAAAAPSPREESKRGRSSIAFPYVDFSKAAAVADAIHAHVGTGTCSVEQLAAWLKQSAKSSSFRSQVSVARMFGLMETGEEPKLSDLGRMLADPKRAREARAKAFLKVPLFNALYEKFKTGVLPPAAALQLEMGALGVAKKQLTLARQVFERSAQQAGYFENGNDRLVMPGFLPTEERLPPKEGNHGEGNGGGGGGGDNTDIDPIIVGLLRRLPKSGDVWPEADRKLWLQLLEGSFKLIYKDNSDH